MIIDRGKSETIPPWEKTIHKKIRQRHRRSEAAVMLTTSVTHRRTWISWFTCL